MENHKDGQTLLIQTSKEFQSLHLMSDIEVTDRFIQKQHFGILGYALGKVNLLPFTLRKRIYNATAQLVYSHAPHHFADDVLFFATVPEPLVEMRVSAHENEFLGRVRENGRYRLGQRGDKLSEPPLLVSAQVFAEEFYGAGPGKQITGKKAQKSCLPRAVGTDNADHLT